MRWASVVVLGACSFTPGSVVTSDGPAGPVDGDAEVPDDASVDPDGPGPDATMAAGKVRMIDVVNAMVAGGPHTDFPLLVSLSGAWLKSTANGGDVARADGFDIYFSADQAGATRLSFEVESYAPVAGTLLAWVKVPSLVPESTFYIHYGDPAITTSQQMVTAVWSAGYELVAHMTSSSDATNKASAISAQTGAAVAGQIGSALTFDGSETRIDYGSDTELDNVFANGGTVESWFNAEAFGESSLGRIISKEDANGWLLSVDDSNITKAAMFQHGGASGSVGGWATPNNSTVLDTWHHIAVVYNKGSSANDATIYLDGAAQANREISSPTGALDSDAGSVLVVGNRPGTDRAFAGLIDETRVSSVSRTANWILTQYRSQSAPTGFLTVGAPL